MTEHILEHLRALSNHPKCILRRPSEKIQLLRDPLHRQRVRKVQQLPRASNLAVLHNVQIPDGCHLHTHARHTLRSSPKKKNPPTSCCLAFSAGGKYGGSGALNRNADASVEKYKMMFPTISRRSLLTGTMKSRRTLCISN